MKNKGERVVYITTEQKFKKFTTTNIEEESKKLEREYKNLEDQ
jgi:chromosomal replication initiation ATPase DnaA